MSCNNSKRHYHGAIETTPEILNRYKGIKGFFIKKFLISDKFNLNRWRVTWNAINKDLDTFLGKPVVLTPSGDHPPTSIQDNYKVGEIIDVGKDELTHTAWQVSNITDVKTQKLIKEKKVRYGSPTVHTPTQYVETQNKGTAAESDILHRFLGKHDALVIEPAYGKIKDVIRAVCEGDGPGCADKLVEVKASLNDSAISQITIVPFIRSSLKKRFKAETLGKVMDIIKKGDNDTCISKKIKIILNDTPDMSHDQAIAIAISHCKEASYTASIENSILNGISQDIFKILNKK